MVDICLDVLLIGKYNKDFVENYYFFIKWYKTTNVNLSNFAEFTYYNNGNGNMFTGSKITVQTLITTHIFAWSDYTLLLLLFLLLIKSLRIIWILKRRLYLYGGHPCCIGPRFYAIKQTFDKVLEQLEVVIGTVVGVVVTDAATRVQQ